VHVVERGERGSDRGGLLGVEILSDGVLAYDQAGSASWRR
jgi:hypothetical protein